MSVRAEDVTAFLRQCTEQLNGRPEYQEYFRQFEDLYYKKLWHQLTDKLVEYVRLPHPRNAPELLALYDRFIVSFANKLNQLTLAQIAVAISANSTDVAAIRAFLARIAESVRSTSSAYVLTCMELAHYDLLVGDADTCKQRLTECSALVDAVPSVEPTMHAAFYRVSAEYDKYRGDYNAFYRNSLLFLACVSLDEMPAEEQVARATDIAVAALLGDATYAFGELLAHDIIKALSSSPNAWLVNMLTAFSRGNMSAFASMRSTIASHGDLAPKSDFLLEKMRLMAVMELFFSREADDRSVAFADIAAQTDLPIDHVEHLVMKAMSLKLIKGTIDQVDQRVHVTHVQSRVLEMSQVAALSTRLGNWATKVKQTAQWMETHSPELFVQ